MGKVVAIEHLSLDGVMQGPARPDEDRRGGFAHGGWGAAGGADPALQPIIGAHMGAAWSLLVGRVTYTDFASVWPSAPQPNSFTDPLNNAQKFVVSNTLSEPLPWVNSTLLQGDGADAVARLKPEHAKTLVIFGSGALVQSLLRRDLIDELVLQIHPLALGSGRRLFAEDGQLTNFTLTEAITTGGGVIVATYRPVSAR